jgi:hypothetical protein
VLSRRKKDICCAVHQKGPRWLYAGGTKFRTYPESGTPRALNIVLDALPLEAEQLENGWKKHSSSPPGQNLELDLPYIPPCSFTRPLFPYAAVKKLCRR